MTFFERQHAARGSTAKLVVLFVVGMLAVVAVVDVVVALLFLRDSGSAAVSAVVVATVVTVLIMTAGTVTKLLSLRAGGAAVALSVGAVAVDPSTPDPRLRRFVNVVEEMSIASGVPMPRLFVLDQEPGINAFAAGFSPSDAAVTVTAGALDRLNRDELQGVIGHEFSHVLNGDMRLNIRLIGLLNGLLLLGLVGLRFLQFGGLGGGRSRERNGNVLLVVAIVFSVVGFVGQFFAGLIKAAVSRQREWLADASAVQFTRQTTGLAGALKKIAGLPEGSQLADSPGERQISHMLFGEGRRGLSQLYATHPPLLDRIRALEPGFAPAQVDELRERWAAARPDGAAEDAALGLAGGATAAPRPAARTPVTPEHVTARVGTLTRGDLDAAAGLAARIPADVRRLAGQQSTAVPLLLALLIDTDPDLAGRQLVAVRDRLGTGVADTVRGYVEGLAPLAAELRLPVVELLAPQLAARPPADRDAVSATLDALVLADGVVTVFEYCLTRVVTAQLRDLADPAARSRRGRATVTSMRDAAVTLVATVAAAGNADPQAAAHAFGAAIGVLLPGATVAFAPPADPWRALDAGWEALRGLDARNTEALVHALVTAVADDGTVTAAEAELLRATCAVLRCPLPPLVA